jgi:hypothetical protein
MSVSSDDIEPETYFWNSMSTLNVLHVGFFWYTESWTLNRIVACLTTETGSCWTGEPLVVASDIDDF